MSTTTRQEGKDLTVRCMHVHRGCTKGLLPSVGRWCFSSRANRKRSPALKNCCDDPLPIEYQSLVEHRTKNRTQHGQGHATAVACIELWCKAFPLDRKAFLPSNK
ncbi:unnamed protein product, partial [Ectocarpus sp. 12 AP-2014]